MATFGGQAGVGTSVETGEIADEAVTNAKVAAAAAIAYSKLNLALGIVDADVSATAAIALSKLASNPLARANHTGTQVAATISDFNAAAVAAVAIEKVVAILATDGVVGAGATLVRANQYVAVRFADNAVGPWTGQIRLPAAVNGLSISSARIFYLDANGGSAKVVTLKVSTQYSAPTAGGAITADATETQRDFTSGSVDNKTGIFTLNGDEFNALPAVATGGILGVKVERQGNAVNDTWGTDWDMYLVEFTFA